MSAAPPRGGALFLVGTDTGVGKTVVGRALAAAARARGLRVRVLKPAESGCARDPGGVLVPADALALARAAGDRAPLDALCPHRYAEPVAPGVAAARAGPPFDAAWVQALATSARAEADLLLIEGAGGLLVPLGDGLLVADLVARLGAPVLLIARSSLGTINHTLLTIAELRRRGLPFAGVVLSETASAPAPDQPHNAAEIRSHGRGPILGTLPHLDPETLDDDARLGRLAAERLDLGALLEAASS